MTHTTEKGYKRFHKGPNRGKYEHRVVMAELCGEWCWYPLNLSTGLPEGFTVDHLDHDRQHNCHQNLVLLQKEIHDHLSWCSMRKLALREVEECVQFTEKPVAA